MALATAVATVAAQTPMPTGQPSPERFKRWVDLDTFSIATRYRYVKANNDFTVNDHWQWQIAVRGRLKFDKGGRYSINAGAFTGLQFASSWNNLGPGTGEPQTNVYVKQLFFSAKPTDEVEVQVGGITINHGENSEATTYDNDGYITGERVIIRAPKKIFFDEISVTNGYLGDLTRPSIFNRLHRLNESNYRQFLVRKQVTNKVGFSSDYTYAAGTDTLREAVRIRPKNFFFDTLLFDAYQRVSTPKGYGLDVFAEKAVNKNVTVNGGFARIDKNFILNGDKFPPGKRLYTSLLFKFGSDFTLSPIFVRAVGDLPTPVTHRTRFDLILTWNVLGTLRRHRIL